jgi:hypothetical protein
VSGAERVDFSVHESRTVACLYIDKVILVLKQTQNKASSTCGISCLAHRRWASTRPFHREGVFFVCFFTI